MSEFKIKWQQNSPPRLMIILHYLVKCTQYVNLIKTAVLKVLLRSKCLTIALRQSRH